MTAHMCASIRPALTVETGETPEPAAIDRRVLILLAAAKHGMTRAQLASRLFQRQARPYRTMLDRQVEMRARKEHQAKARKLTRYALDRLVRRGHVETTQRHQLASETRSAMERMGLEAVRDRAYVEAGEDIVGVLPGESVPVDTHAARIVLALFEHPEGMEPGELKAASGGLTASGGESGAWRRALRGWEQSGDVVSAGLRRITQEGRRALEGAG